MILASGIFSIFTLPAGVVMKYCDDHVCVSVCLLCGVCLSASISSEPHTIFTKFLVHVVCGRGWVIFRQGDKIPRGRGNLGFSSTLTMHCNVLAVKGMIQSPIMSCSRRDHSVAATFAANGIGREGGDGVHSAGEV